MDCSVCCSKFNKSTFKEIVCGFCEYSCCRTCFQKFLVTINQDPCCMNCKKEFNRDFVTNNCTSVFINSTLKEHRCNVLFDREKSLLPATQPYVTIEKEKNKILSEIKDLGLERDRISREYTRKILQINELRRTLYTLDNSEPERTHERKVFIKKCPMENCRGFLSTQWKCGVCDSKICNNCNELKEENHECKPENVATLELLKKDSKGCPECGTVIFKIEGCSQMYCTNCNTPWDWNTHLKVSGVIHNPHYYDFIRNGGNLRREHGDIPCGGLPTYYEFRMFLSRNVITPSDFEMFTRIHNVITHIQGNEIRNIVETVNDATNRKLRVNYLLNLYSEDQFKRLLQEHEKKRSKAIDFNNIYQMFVNVGSDIYRQIMVTKNLSENKDILLNLITYFNENLKKLGKNYKCVYPGINENYQFKNNINLK